MRLLCRSWEDLLTDQASYTVNTKNLNDIMSDLDALMTGPDPHVLVSFDCCLYVWKSSN